MKGEAFSLLKGHAHTLNAPFLAVSSFAVSFYVAQPFVPKGPPGFLYRAYAK